jgi:dihydrofolate reductase
MRKVIVSNLVTLDGFFAGPNGEIDWHVVDEEFFNYVKFELQNEVDTILFGRVTYEGMASYWPTPAAAQNDPDTTDYMNKTPKIVFSKTLAKADWNNSTLVKGDLAQEVSKLKQQPGKNLVIYGSGTIVSALAQLGLIDDYRIFVVPVVLGRGKPLFSDITMPINLKLLRTKTFKTGVVLLSYEPDRK